MQCKTTHMYYIIVPVGQQSRDHLVGSLQGSNQEWDLISWLTWERVHLFLTQVIGGFCFFEAIEPRAVAYCWLYRQILGTIHNSSTSKTPNMANCFIKAGKKERVPKVTLLARQIFLLYNVVTEVTSLHFCYILLFEVNYQPYPHARGRNYTRV